MKTKKILGIALAVCMTIGLTTVPAMAEDKKTIVLGDTTIKAEKEEAEIKAFYKSAKNGSFSENNPDKSENNPNKSEKNAIKESKVICTDVPRARGEFFKEFPQVQPKASETADFEGIDFDKLKEKVVNPLTGKKIGAYYGCLLLRPGKIMAFDDPENPTIMEDFIRALGAEPVIYPYRNECCGGYISLKEKDMSQNMCQKIEDSAKGFGADMLITACPLCKYNLNKNASSELPVYYFTELLAEALGVKEEVAK